MRMFSSRLDRVTDGTDVGSTERAVSAKHAVVTCEVKDAEASPPELEVKIVDLSRNGVTLNGVKLKKDEYVALKDGDVVTLPFHLEYRFELNPEGTLPRSTRALLNGAPTPLQLKKRSSPGASVGDGREDGSNSKRARGNDDDGAAAAEALRAAREANETLRARVEELEKTVEATRREAEADAERRKQSDETNDAQVVDELERRLASAEQRAASAENELDEAKRVVENAASATKELETKLAETTASKEALETSLEVAEARRIEEIEALKSEHASVVESLNARVADVVAETAPLRESLASAKAQLEKNGHVVRESHELAKQLFDKLGESVRATASVSFGDEGDDDEMTTRERTPRKDAADDDGERPSGDAADDRGDDKMDRGNTDVDETTPGGEANGDAASTPLRSIGNSPLPESESAKRRGARDSEGVIPMNVLED